MAGTPERPREAPDGQPVTGDRHKTRPKAVRMPGGLLPWYEEFAAKTGQSVNAALVAALEEFRTRRTVPAPVVPGPEPEPAAPVASSPDCTHRVSAGAFCKRCDRIV